MRTASSRTLCMYVVSMLHHKSNISCLHACSMHSSNNSRQIEGCQHEFLFYPIDVAKMSVVMQLSLKSHLRMNLKFRRLLTHWRSMAEKNLSRITKPPNLFKKLSPIHERIQWSSQWLFQDISAETTILEVQANGSDMIILQVYLATSYWRKKTCFYIVLQYLCLDIEPPSEKYPPKCTSAASRDSSPW